MNGKERSFSPGKYRDVGREREDSNRKTRDKEQREETKRRKIVKGHHNTYIETSQEAVKPIDEIAGFPVRPGLFDINGAMPLQNGVKLYRTHQPGDFL